MASYDPELQKIVARLKIESKLKHLQDLSNSGGARFRKTFMPQSIGYNFFSILDQRVQSINRAHPITLSQIEEWRKEKPKKV